MTDPVDRELSPEEEARIAALLAHAGGPVPMPQDVADRLDGVLAGLVHGRAEPTPLTHAASAAGPTTPAGVTRLRPRRRGPALLLAAAAVVAGGFAVSSLVDDAPVTESTAQDAAREGGGSGAHDGSDSAPESGAGAGSDDAEPSAAAPGVAAAPEGALRSMPDRRFRLVPSLGPVTLSAARLEADVLGALRAGQAMDVVPRPDASATGPACPTPALGAGESWTPAEYAGEPAVLVAGPEREGTVDASVRSCTGAVLATVPVEVR